MPIINYDPEFPDYPDERAPQQCGVCGKIIDGVSAWYSYWPNVEIFCDDCVESAPRVTGAEE